MGVSIMDRDIEQLRADFVKTGEPDFLTWLIQQPEGSPGSSQTVSSIGQNFEKSRGLGDTIAKMTTAVGIKPCGGCKKRQEYLNKKMPYKN